MMAMQSRRTVLSLVAGGVAATIASPTPAVGNDPVFGNIQVHRTARVAHFAALAEQTRLEGLGDLWGAGLITEAPCHAEMDAFNELIGTAPRTLAGLRAWGAYLDEIRGDEEWMFEDGGPTLVATLAEALGNLPCA
jgi:hypothetical protein